MEGYDTDYLKKYLEFFKIVNGRFGKSLNDLLDPSDELVEMFRQYYMMDTERVARECVMGDLEDDDEYEADDEDLEFLEDMEDDVSREEFMCHVDIIKKIVAYMIVNTNETNEKLVNEIIQNDISKVVTAFVENDGYSKMMMKFYIQYIIDMNYNTFFAKRKAKVLKDNPWIDELEYNKGYKTVNDEYRQMIMEKYYDACSLATSIEEIFKSLDEYFESTELDYYVKEHFPEYNTPEKIRRLKENQLKLVLADAYLALKTYEIKSSDDGLEWYEMPLSDEETECLDALYSALAEKDYSLLTPKMRAIIYNEFIASAEGDPVYREHVNVLKSQGEDKILRLGNPLYFLD